MIKILAEISEGVKYIRITLYSSLFKNINYITTFTCNKLIIQSANNLVIKDTYKNWYLLTDNNKFIYVDEILFK